MTRIRGDEPDGFHRAFISRLDDLIIGEARLTGDAFNRDAGCMSDFSALTAQCSATELINAFNDYLEICSASFIAYGGQVARYSRSGIIVHFAPDQVDIAIGACEDAYKRLQDLLANQSRLSLGSIQFGFGIVSGSLIEGNIGSSIKMDYTVLGDTVDEAMHLAVFARDMNHAIAVDQSILANADPSWGFVPAGNFEFSDLNKTISIYTRANFKDSPIAAAYGG